MCVENGKLCALVHSLALPASCSKSFLSSLHSERVALHNMNSEFWPWIPVHREGARTPKGHTRTKLCLQLQLQLQVERMESSEQKEPLPSAAAAQSASAGLRWVQLDDLEITLEERQVQPLSHSALKASSL